jgi:hypothetical protein
MLNDQSAGLSAKVVSGTPRDSLNFIDVVQLQQGGTRPEAIITDTGSRQGISWNSTADASAALLVRRHSRNRAPPGPWPGSEFSSQARDSMVGL